MRLVERGKTIVKRVKKEVETTKHTVFMPTYLKLAVRINPKFAWLSNRFINHSKMKTKLTLILSLMLLCSIKAKAQYDFSKVDNWLNYNAAEMGGRVVLVVYKDGA